MRSSWFSAAAAVCLAAAPASAQDRPVVFVHGLLNTGSQWAGAAAYLRSVLKIDTIRPTLGWPQIFETQADNLENALAGRTNVVAVSHSNGGVVTRQYGRTRGSSSVITGHVAVGSLHQGAPLAANFLDGALGDYINELAFSLADPIQYYYDNDPAFHTAVDSSYEFVIWLNGMVSVVADYGPAAFALITDLSLQTVPVLPEMCPEQMPCPGTSNFIADLNSSASLAAEASAFQQRVSISTEVPTTNVWARSWCPSGCTGIPPVIADIALDKYDDYSNSSNPVLQFGASKWLHLWEEMISLDSRWLELIGAVTENGVVAQDGILPITTQTYAGGTGVIHLGGANIAHGEQPTNALVIQTLNDVLHNTFGIPTHALQVTISGPSNPPTSGSYVWTAVPNFGSPSDYAYQWQYQYEGSPTWNPLGTGQSQSFIVDGSGPSFTLKVTITSSEQSAVASLFVTPPPYVEIGGPGYISTKGTYHFPATPLHFGGTPTFTWYERFCDDVGGGSCTGWVNVPNVGSTYTRTLSHDCSGTGSKNFQLHVIAAYGSQSDEDYHTTYLCIQ